MYLPVTPTVTTAARRGRGNGPDSFKSAAEDVWPATRNWLRLPHRNGGRNVFATLLLALTPGQYVDSKEFPREKQEAALAATAGIVHVPTNGEGTAVVVKYDKQKGEVYLLTAAHVVPP